MLLRLLIYLLLGYILYRIIRSLITKNTVEPPRPKAVDTHKDPICGVYVSDDDAVVGTLEGKRIYFCSHECLEKFRDQLTNTNNTQ